jgi:hypothetical protein
MFKYFTQIKFSNKIKFVKFFSTIDKPKVLKLDIDEFGNKKMTLEEFKPAVEEPKKKPTMIKKVKMFGQSEIETLDEVDDKEEIEENRLNRELFYSDQCRIYVKAGDGGNGLHSTLKGHLFDQSTSVLI